MRLPLDSHIVVAFLERRLRSLPVSMAEVLEVGGNAMFVSVASLWEIAIKSRLGKLQLAVPLQGWKDSLSLLGVGILAVEAEHVLADIGPEPDNKDPFDRLFPGVCAAEGLKLMTLDRTPISHPLAWRET
jgi:PIN domain nuclease of toxin-antitoxin system